MTVAQLTGAWSCELSEGGEDPKQCEQNLGHILMVDILNGRLDDSGPLADGRRLGFRLITPEYKAAFIEGPQLHDLIRTKEGRLLHYVVVMRSTMKVWFWYTIGKMFTQAACLWICQGGSFPTQRSMSSNPTGPQWAC
jgi:hypothetical protein